MGERFWRIGVLAHDGAYGQDHRQGGFVACTSKIGLLEVGKPFNNFLGFRVCEEKSDLAFYLLQKTVSFILFLLRSK